MKVFQHGGFEVDLRKVKSEIFCTVADICTNFMKIWTCTFREITASVMNDRANETSR